MFLFHANEHVTRWEFASQPNLCSGKRAAIQFESALGKGMNCRDVTSRVPPLSSPFSILPLLQFEWKDYSQGKMTFNLKISPLIFPFLPVLPTHFISTPSS